MGYLHVNNLYKDKTILMFKECYALEKIHGTSAHISWNHTKKKLSFYSGGENHEKFLGLFPIDHLEAKFTEMFIDSNAIIYGEAYGGSQQRMSGTYGPNLKFVAFDVEVNEKFVNLPTAVIIVEQLGLEFVAYEKVSTDLESLNFERDRDSTQSIRNGVGPGKMREGVVLRPLIELIDFYGNRIIAKHKRDEFKETKTKREVDPKDFEILTESIAVAEEWVTSNRICNIFSHLKDEEKNIKNMSNIIKIVIDDIHREASGEAVFTKIVDREIAKKCAIVVKHFMSMKN